MAIGSAFAIVRRFFPYGTAATFRFGRELWMSCTVAATERNRRVPDLLVELAHFPAQLFELCSHFALCTQFVHYIHRRSVRSRVTRDFSAHPRAG